MVIFIEAQLDGSNGEVGNGAALLVRSMVQVAVPADSRSDVSAHGFCNWGTIMMFDIRIVNLNTGSYLRMMKKHILQMQRRKRRIHTFRLTWSIDIRLL